jgi:uncharacterized protein
MNAINTLVEFARRTVPVLNALESQPGFVEKLYELRKVAEDLGKSVTPMSPCARGCSHCCHTAVAISQAEAEVIGGEIGIAPAMPDERRGDYNQYEKAFRGVPCTFLVGPECSIYESRPMACRLLYSLEANSGPCERMENVTKPNTRPIEFMLVRASKDTVLADVREFFPNGRG